LPFDFLGLGSCFSSLKFALSLGMLSCILES
jgi:hypothetical protein